jgi:hypothetical protein
MSTTPGIELLLDLHKQSLASAARRPHHIRPAAHGAGRRTASTAARFSLTLRWERFAQGPLAASSPSSAARPVACCA